MDLTNRKIIKTLLQKYGAKAEKRFGQHFVLSKNAIAKMVATAEIKNGDAIIEIGPGLGTLTRELAATGAKIIAIEKDSLMIEILGDTLKDFKNVKIIQADARNLLNISISTSDVYKFIDIGCRYSYKIVANLPYNTATFLIRQWLELKKPPQTMVLMIQKEVAQRIVAGPPRMNLLGVSVQFFADAKIIGYVSAAAFWPRPKVVSAIMKIVPKKNVEFRTIASKTAFFKIVKAGFSHPRKLLIGNLIKKLPAKNLTKEKLITIFKNLNIPETARAENLSVEQWASLCRASRCRS